MARPKTIKDAPTVNTTEALEKLRDAIRASGIHTLDGRPIEDYDPLVALGLIAADPTTDLKLRADLHKELAQYFYPKKKAVEVSGPNGGPQEYRIVIKRFTPEGEK